MNDFLKTLQTLINESKIPGVRGSELTKGVLLVTTEEGLIKVTAEDTSIGEAFGLDLASLELS